MAVSHLCKSLLFPLWPIVLLLFCLTTASGADWPHWRGPQRTGTTSELSGWQGGAWPPAKPAWRKNVGAGGSSPLVVAGRLYTLGWKDNRDHLSCLDAATGREIWTQSYPCPAYSRRALGDQEMYSGPSATPEYDRDTGYLYTLSTDGDLHCWDTRREGQKIWGLNLFDHYQIDQRPKVPRSMRRDYGCTAAPLVWKDWLLVEVGARQGSVAAFDKRTGKQRWLSALRDPAGLSGGLVPMTVEGVPCVAVFTHQHLAVLRLDAGREGQTVAAYPWTTNAGCNIATPAVQDNYVLITSAYNHNTLCKLQITLQGAKRVWETPYPSGVCSPVIHQGNVYLAFRTVRCLDFATGAEKWSGGDNLGFPGSCLVTGDDRLIVWGGNGQLLLAEIARRSPDHFTVLARTNKVLPALAWPHVVLAGRRLYCKDRAGNLVCLLVRAD